MLAAEAYLGGWGIKAALDDGANPRFAVDEVESWSTHAVRVFELHALSGGHFFLADHQDEILRVITDRVMSVTERG